MVGCNEEYADKESRIVGTADIIEFVISRQYGFKYQTLLLPKTLLTESFAVLHRLHDGFAGVPVTELIFGYLVGVDIDSILHPLML